MRNRSKFNRGGAKSQMDLTDEQKGAIYVDLRDGTRMSLKEIAEKENLSLDTIYSRYITGARVTK